MLDVLLEPFRYPFMVNAFLAAVIVSVVCAVVGTFIVLRGMAFFGDALAHTILPGLAVGYLVSGSARDTLFWYALATGVISALSIGAISRKTRIKEDTAIGIIFAGTFALGIALISTAQSYAVDLSHFLFGDVLAVTDDDLIRTAAFGAVILLAVLAFYKELVVVSFDPTLAVTLRLPNQLLEYLLLVMIAITIVVALQTVGVALMVAMLVTPAATAFLLTRRLPVMMGLAAIFGSLAGIVGLYLSFYIQIPSGAAIVLVATAFFGLTFTAAPRRRKVKRALPASEVRAS